MTLEKFLERIDEIMCGTSNAERTYLEDLYNEVTNPHWVSVEDERPPKYDSYLTRSSGNAIEITHYNIDGWHTESKGNVTHWMSLPKMPILSNSSNAGKDLKGGEG